MSIYSKTKSARNLLYSIQKLLLIQKARLDQIQSELLGIEKMFLIKVGTNKTNTLKM